MGFNQLLRYLGFSVGSAVSGTLIDLYGGAAGYTAAALTLAAVCLVAGVGASFGYRTAATYSI